MEIFIVKPQIVSDISKYIQQNILIIRFDIVTTASHLRGCYWVDHQAASFSYGRSV